MGFKEAFSPKSEKSKAELKEKIKRIREEIKKECLKMNFTENEIQDAYQAFEKDYKGCPNFVYRPSHAEYMEVEYRNSPNRTVFESNNKEEEK